MPKYVEPAASRLRREVVSGVEQIAIPVHRSWFTLLFLPFWLLAWTAGGIAASIQFAQTGEPFLAVWLCAWLVGEVFALLTLGEQIWGREVIRPIAGDLEVSGGFGPIKRRKLYRGDLIRNLRVGDRSGIFDMIRMPMPTFLKQRWGTVKFDYGAETIYLASNAEEAEGRKIVDWLRPKLPRSATGR